jgi:hypothetical protein
MGSLLNTMTFIAALRVDRIDAPINGERFGGTGCAPTT